MVRRYAWFGVISERIYKHGLNKMQDMLFFFAEFILVCALADVSEHACVWYVYVRVCMYFVGSMPFCLYILNLCARINLYWPISRISRLEGSFKCYQLEFFFHENLTPTHPLIMLITLNRTSW